MMTGIPKPLRFVVTIFLIGLAAYLAGKATEHFKEWSE